MLPYIAYMDPMGNINNSGGSINEGTPIAGSKRMFFFMDMDVKYGHPHFRKPPYPPDYPNQTSTLHFSINFSPTPRKAEAFRRLKISWEIIAPLSCTKQDHIPLKNRISNMLLHVTTNP